MAIIIFVLFILYIISFCSCVIYFMDKNIEPNIISFFVAFCPIINTIYAFKCPSIKKTIKQLTGKKK